MSPLGYVKVKFFGAFLLLPLFSFWLLLSNKSAANCFRACRPHPNRLRAARPKLRRRILTTMRRMMRTNRRRSRCSLLRSQVLQAPCLALTPAQSTAFVDGGTAFSPLPAALVD
jgi:hypothetical protein